jgi:hypothetical protein
LRAQPPPPPPENRDEVAALKQESNRLREELRLEAGGFADHVDRPDIHKRFDELAERCLALGAPDVALGIYYWRVMFTPQLEARAAVIDKMIALAEQTRNDRALVGALTLDVVQRLAAQQPYDVAKAEAVLARARTVADRIGMASCDLKEAERFHAQRSRRYADAVRLLGEQALVCGDGGRSANGIGLRLMRVQFQLKYGDVDLVEGLAATRDREAQLGPDDGVVGEDQALLAELYSRTGDLEAAHRFAQRGVSIFEKMMDDPYQRRFVHAAHRKAFVHALAAGHADVAAAHLRTSVELREEGSIAHAHASLFDDLNGWGLRAAAAYVLAAAEPVAASDLDRAELAARHAALQLDAGGAFDASWDQKLAALPPADRHPLLARIHARSGRAAQALAHVDAIENPKQQRRLKGRTLFELGRVREALVLLEPFPMDPWRGRALLASGQPAKAIAPLENAAWTLGVRNAESADVRFAWARAIVESGGDRAQAKRQATLARDALVAMGLPQRAAPIDTWLATVR